MVHTVRDHLYSNEFNPQYIYLDGKLLASLMYWYIHFLPGFSGAEIKYTVHVTLPKQPIS